MKVDEERKAKKNEWLKKTKKKPKTEDEDAKDMEDLRQKVSTILAQQLVDVKIDKAESDVELEKIKWLLDNHIVMDEKQYDILNRK